MTDYALDLNDELTK